MSRILGIDPGTQKTGYALFEADQRQPTWGLRHVDHGVLSSSPRVDFEKRVLKLGDQFEKLLEQFQPEWIVLEKIFLGKNADSAFKLGHIRGVYLFLAQNKNCQVAQYAARSVKKGITGNGGADKNHVRFFLQKTFQLSGEIPIDASDAMGLAVYHWQKVRLSERIARQPPESPC